MKKFLFLIVIVVSFQAVAAQSLGPLYTKKDSARIVALLNEARRLPAKTNDVLFFAKKFIGVPYGAATLERSDTERLILNLDLLDCTTYVDVVTALTLCHRNGLRTFKDFCRYLEKIRYRHGRIDGYTSRNHYYSSWIRNAEEQRLVHELTPADWPNVSPFTGVQRLDIYFMSKNSNLYPALVKHPEYIPAIRKTEEDLTGRTVRYIPKKALGGPKYLLGRIHDGDILAMVTKKGGLDVSHLGFAVWGKDGKLHLLNASSLRKRVVLELRTLQAYSKSQKMQLGVRVIRIQK
jgi:hypothetical protein